MLNKSNKTVKKSCEKALNLKTKINMAKKLQKSYKNAFLKKKVLSLFLETDTEELFLMSDGRVFQRVGAATEKYLAPYVLKLKCGIERRFLDDERS